MEKYMKFMIRNLEMNKHIFFLFGVTLIFLVRKISFLSFFFFFFLSNNPHFFFSGVSTIDLSGCRMTRLPLGLTKIPHPETKVIYFFSFSFFFSGLLIFVAIKNKQTTK